MLSKGKYNKQISYIHLLQKSGTDAQYDAVV